MLVELHVPSDFAERLAPIVEDLNASAGVRLDFKDEPWSGDFPSCMLWDASGSGTGISFDPSARDAETLAALADEVQEVVIEARWAAGVSPVAWPECPAHRTHPLEAIVDGDEARWACPKDRSIAYEIGSLR